MAQKEIIKTTKRQLLWITVNKTEFFLRQATHMSQGAEARFRNSGENFFSWQFLTRVIFCLWQTLFAAPPPWKVSRTYMMWLTCSGVQITRTAGQFAIFQEYREIFWLCIHPRYVRQICFKWRTRIAFPILRSPHAEFKVFETNSIQRAKAMERRIRIMKHLNLVGVPRAPSLPFQPWKSMSQWTVNIQWKLI